MNIRCVSQQMLVLFLHWRHVDKSH